MRFSDDQNSVPNIFLKLCFKKHYISEYKLFRWFGLALALIWDPCSCQHVRYTLMLMPMPMLARYTLMLMLKCHLDADIHHFHLMMFSRAC